MSRVLFRPTEPADLPDVAGLWQAAFSDPPDLVRWLLTEGGLLRRGMTAELDGQPAAVMFAFPGLDLGGRSAAYLYALCTRADVRGRGLGSGLLEALAARCFAGGSELVFLSPADAGLARWYRERLGFAPLCGIRDLPQLPGAGAPGRCTPIDPETYLSAREGACTLTEPLLRAQAIILEAGGGGLFWLSLSDGTALASAVPTPRGLLVLELLCPPAARSAALGTLAAHFSTRRLLLRCPGGETPLLYRSRDGKAPALAPDFCFPFILD